MSPRQDRPSIRSRATLAVGVAAIAIVAIAARQPEPQPTAMPAMAAPTVTATDSTVQPDTMALMIDTASVMMTMQPAEPMPVQGPPQWPVDPVTGQTLINGIPVVGRVFVQQKPDGLKKIKDVEAVLAPEALAPEAAIVATTHTTLPTNAIRRQRNIMVQSMLWAIDEKPSVVKKRHYYPTTSGASLGQR